MGAVYEVVHANTGEHLALKVMLARSLLSPDLVERFRREARIQSTVKSEHVVRVIDADVAPELDGAPFLAMELLSGRDFERICTERQPSPEEVVDWLGQVSRALDKAHRERIVHRDLKPENLFLAEREELPPIVKILDFGVAKMATEGDGGGTATGQILGTPRYMAPEQAVAAKQITAAADRFALGLIAFRLVCGRHYFDDDNWVRLLQTVTLGPGARPSEMGCDRGPAFDAWFARACALDPNDRFVTCVEQLEALAGALDGVSVVGRRRRWLGPPRRTLTWTGFAGACGLAVLAWGLGRTRAVPPAPAVRATAVPAPINGDREAGSVVASPAPVSAPAQARAPASDSNPRPRRRARVVAVGATRPEAAPAPKDRIWEEP
jgi:serine/threonine-protein kinase